MPQFDGHLRPLPAAPVTRGIAPRFPLGIGLLLIGAGSLLRVTMTTESGWTVLIPGLAVTGVGVGLASPVLVSAALAAVPGTRRPWPRRPARAARRRSSALPGRTPPSATSFPPAYAAGQNDIYLAAGAAALLGGILALVLIRPGPPGETVPATPAAPSERVRAS